MSIATKLAIPLVVFSALSTSLAFAAGRPGATSQAQDVIAARHNGTLLTPQNDAFYPFTSGVGPTHPSREQVKKDVLAARRDGTLLEAGDEPDYPFASTLADTHMTREQVRREVELWRAHPVTSDGYREVRGDVGWVYEGR